MNQKRPRIQIIAATKELNALFYEAFDLFEAERKLNRSLEYFGSYGWNDGWRWDYLNFSEVNHSFQDVIAHFEDILEGGGVIVQVAPRISSIMEDYCFLGTLELAEESLKKSLMKQKEWDS